MTDKINTQDPIRLSSFRREAIRTRSGSMERQMRLSFGIVFLLLLATATIGLSNFSATRNTQDAQIQDTSPAMTNARSAAINRSARG